MDTRVCTDIDVAMRSVVGPVLGASSEYLITVVCLSKSLNHGITLVLPQFSLLASDTECLIFIVV